MDSITNFYDAYQESSPEKRSLIDSDAIGVFVSTLIEKNHLSPQLKQKLMVVVSNLVVGVNKSEYLDRILTNTILTPANLDAIKQEIMDFQSNPPNTTTGLENEINELERSLTDLQPIRTMAHDMQSHPNKTEAVHQSSQDALLQKDDAERWESSQNN